MLTLFEDYRKEFRVDDDGITYQSKRCVAGFCGTGLSNWGNSYYFFNKEVDALVFKVLKLDFKSVGKNKSKSIEILADKGFVIVGEKQYFIKDALSTIVVNYYAYAKGNDCAISIAEGTGAIGLRTIVQNVMGWKGSKDYGHLMRTSPRKWTKVFGDEFYDELSRLTNLPWDRKTHQTPFVFAHLTNEFVYKHLPKDVYKAIKDNQSKHNGYIQKVHQFLSDEGLELLHNHLTLTIGILSGASSLANARLAMHHAITRNYQGSLFVEA